MDFTIGTKEQAASADNVVEYVSEPGAYAGNISIAKIRKFESGAEALEIGTTDNDGKICKINLIVKTKKGESTYDKDGKKYPLPGINTIQGSLLPCLGCKSLSAEKDKEGNVHYPLLIGKPLGMLINIRLTTNPKNGKNYANADLRTFFNPKTNLCGSEILNGVKTPIRKNEISKVLKTIDETTNTTNNKEVEDPFKSNTGVNSADSVNEDPFEDSSLTNKTQKEEVKQETKQVKADTKTTTKKETPNLKIVETKKEEVKKEVKQEVKQEQQPVIEEPLVEESPFQEDNTNVSDQGNFW